MKLHHTLLLGCGVALVAASPQPELQWDPDTISTCIEWFNNGGSDTCVSVWKLFGITPQDFHTWNPSVGLDCKPWNYQSYCVLTKERLASHTPTTTTASPTTTKASPTTHVPSPTAWLALGCYTDNNAQFPVLEKQLSAADTALTIRSCEDSCWKASNRTVLYAGVKHGNQCWCGSFVGGQTTRNQTECNTPCSGNAQAKCGGQGRINVFEPVTTKAPATTKTSPKTGTAPTAAANPWLVADGVRPLKSLYKNTNDINNNANNANNANDPEDSNDDNIDNFTDV
ncbi:hypothetical protein F5Y14DRAFT_454957 [Nemania sp. NC0429]|nr:hypothetical protein F5Y14DRAFT_454957 [Nemania sp. NC0429]